ncbi:MAG: hypothetical protein U9Q76_08130 [candidate division WOR-3 bacterium]|nr:hypothetical protein [candidate division WOR-3 bacterium]
MNKANIFTYYKQKENQFTNGLISLLELSRLDNPQFVTEFLRDTLRLVPTGEVNKFHVLQEKETGGTADAELAGEDFCIWLESKIVSGSLRSDQIDAHLKNLYPRPEKLKRLVLLTPDDSNSMYIRKFVSIDPNLILHLEWKRVYKFLENSVKKNKVFSELVRQFLLLIRDTIFKQDFAGIIQKIAFTNKSGVNPRTYLNELKTGEFSTRWNTPGPYKQLDGTGRKLMLYDGTQKGITVEVEIEKVEETGSEPDYPWTNEFAKGTLCFFVPPIPLSRIQSLEGFGKFRKSRAIRNITHEQYRKLTEGMNKIC